MSKFKIGLKDLVDDAIEAAKWDEDPQTTPLTPGSLYQLDESFSDMEMKVLEEILRELFDIDDLSDLPDRPMLIGVSKQGDPTVYLHAMNDAATRFHQKVYLVSPNKHEE